MSRCQRVSECARFGFDCSLQRELQCTSPPPPQARPFGCFLRGLVWFVWNWTKMRLFATASRQKTQTWFVRFLSLSVAVHKCCARYVQWSVGKYFNMFVFFCLPLGFVCTRLGFSIWIAIEVLNLCTNGFWSTGFLCCIIFYFYIKRTPSNVYCTYM